MSVDGFKSVHELLSFIRGNHAIEDLIAGTWYQSGIVLRNNGCLIRDMSVHIADKDPRQVELGKTVPPEFQRRGFAAEALSLLLNTLFVERNAPTKRNELFASP